MANSIYKASKINRKPIFDKSSYGQAWEDYKRTHPLKGQRCSKCNSKNNLQRHHRITVIKGGRHSEANIQILCKICHELQHPHMQRFNR